MVIKNIRPREEGKNSERRREDSKRSYEEEENEVMKKKKRRNEEDLEDIMTDQEEKEKKFEYSQFKIKVNIRIHEGRPKLIDRLFMYIHRQPTNNNNTNFNFDDVDDMINHINGLSVEEIKQVYEEIKLVMELDDQTDTRRYWEALLVICEWEGLRKEASTLLLHSSIEAEVIDLLKLKNYVELEQLQTEIESKMLSGEAKVVEYWQGVIKHLRYYKAKAFLKGTTAHEDKQQQQQQQEERGGESRSPELLHFDEYKEDDGLIIDPIEDGGEKAPSGYSSNNKYLLQPRKPKYNVRVHTGYNWNKYNRIHYDYDHPPPKMVLGYKFTILYPNLFEKGKAPVFTTEKDNDGDDTCILMFHAGPPYEDIAFKIVNREWDYSCKHGFKSTFDGRVLQLFFNFKRFTYRR